MKNLGYILILLFLVTCSSNRRKSDPSPGEEYTCPMHPEITKSEPGQCPVCGMDLVRRQKKEISNLYTCPMHPDIIRNEPGTCPVCGMDLVQKQADKTGTKDTSIQFLLKPTNQFVVSKIKTVKMTQNAASVHLIASGIITYDPRYTNSVSSRVGGRIEKLFVKYRFQPVKKGDKLMEIYSEELVTEQQNYIYLLHHEPSGAGIINSAETKLQVLGLTKEQIQNLKTSRQIRYSVPVYSEYTGHLHEEKTNQNNNTMIQPSTSQEQLSVREGMYVQKGQTVFNIYSTEKLWAVINVPAENQSLLVKNQSLKLSAEGIKDSITGKIDFVEPIIRPDQNFIAARVYINNPDNDLTIGTIVRANIVTSAKKGNFLPSSAVINLGRTSVVFIMKQKLFEAKEVVTGTNHNGWVQIISGLNKSDAAAENAQLLIDSEAFVRTVKQ